jgi:hypothetical protein
VSLLLHRRSLLKSAGTATFNPMSIAGLSTWLKADSLVLSDGNPVATWADSSGNGHDATQATAGKRPLYKTGILNGNPAVLFDGVDDILDIAAPVSNNSFSLFVAFEPVASSDGYGAMYTSNGVGGLFYRGATRKLDMYSGSDHNSTAAVTEGAGHLFTAVNQSGPNQLDFWVDTVADGSFTAVSAIAASEIGDDGGSETFKGYIAEIIEYDSALSTGNRQAVESYLKTKYGTP